MRGHDYFEDIPVVCTDRLQQWFLSGEPQFGCISVTRYVNLIDYTFSLLDTKSLKKLYNSTTEVKKIVLSKLSRRLEIYKGNEQRFGKDRDRIWRHGVIPYKFAYSYRKYIRAQIQIVQLCKTSANKKKLQHQIWHASSRSW